MSFPIHHCAHCGHSHRTVDSDIIDVWPTGLAGVASRMRAAGRKIQWKPPGGGRLGLIVVQAVGFSGILWVGLALLLEVENYT